jgi:hypothetical protein
MRKKLFGIEFKFNNSELLRSLSFDRGGSSIYMPLTDEKLLCLYFRHKSAQIEKEFHIPFLAPGDTLRIKFIESDNDTPFNNFDQIDLEPKAPHKTNQIGMNGKWGHILIINFWNRIINN